MKILEPNQCMKISKFSRNQSFMLFNSFNECFYNSTYLCNPARIYINMKGGNNCTFSQEIGFIKFCFDQSHLLSGIILNKDLFLYPIDAYHLHLYLKALI